MTLTTVVWPQFAVKVYGVQSVPPFGVMGAVGVSELVPQDSRRATLFLLLQSFSVKRTV